LTTETATRATGSDPDARSNSPVLAPSKPGWLKWIVTLLGVTILLGGAAAASYWIQASEPTAQREAATKRSAALVETVAVERGDFRPSIRALGQVQPARQVVLSPRVGGPIVEVDARFQPGGIVATGDPLVRLDPADYEQALVVRESELGQVEAALAIEEGQQRAAKIELELLGGEVDEANRPLALREPQIASLRAQLRAAEAAVRQARLDLERTAIRAPFDAQILERFVELGSQVAPGEPLARLVGTEEYWVLASLPLASIERIEFPGEHGEGSQVRLRLRSVWAPDEYRVGRVVRFIGEVDDSTRLARVLISVPAPLGADGAPALVLGTLVQVEIEARVLEDVVRLDRALLRQGDTVWVLEEGELRIRPVEVEFSDSQYAYVRAGLADGARVVTTNLATVVDGLPIRELSSAESGIEGGVSDPAVDEGQP
jgi:RND family efflux transporter MFP subunit